MHTETTQTLVLHIEKIGRFGNYYYTKGWHTGPKLGEERFAYEFPNPQLQAGPEFGFYDEKLESDESSEPRKRFLHLFWVNDGYLAKVDTTSPIRISILSHESAKILTSAHFHKLQDANSSDFLEALRETKSKDTWSNRVALELVADRSVDDQIAYFEAAVDACGWEPAHAVLRNHCDRLEQTKASSLASWFYAKWAQSLDMVYMPHELKESLLEAAQTIEPSNCTVTFAEQIIEQLSRIAHPEACRFATKIIMSPNRDIREIQRLLNPCFPRNCKWWMAHVLGNDALGPEQKAEALNLAGYAAANQQQPELAQLCYVSALAIKPDSQSVAWNLGWLHACKGDVNAADEAFSIISRHYPSLSLCTAWPSTGGTVWPAPQTTSGFELPDGITEWPRITIVTPSYNQGVYIEETILSVFHQNYPNLQYIVVDGNSTDETRDILERYRDRIDHLIIEPDNGQTEAINKGLRLADGEVIAWLNSDDMYAPGALHAAALTWLRNQADIIAGQCIEHTDHRILLINKPAARNPDFTPPQLARIFKYWLKGYYFYQPEVFFSKRILDKVGLLNESLYYSMDYDLWLRFAKAEASLDVINWPVAFFRKHDAQKTTNLIDCIEEQARVRTSHYNLVPGDERHYQIVRSLNKFRGKKQVSVGILTKRLGKIFSQSIQQELDTFVDGKYRCVLGDDESHPDIAKADLVVLLVHVLDDLDTIANLRESRADRPIIGWFWDNHHHLFANQAVSEALDAVIPGHAVYSEYLRSDQSILAGHVPLCVTQWARQDAEDWFGIYDAPDRNPNLYGGFVDYHFEPDRTKFLHGIMERLPEHALTILSEDNLKAYFGRSERDRFAEWCGYQTSLVLPLRNDLSQRVFDALLAGLIPLVPEEITDLDLVVPPELQESLPIIRFRMKDPSSAVAAHQKALGIIAAQGPEGARARHTFALGHHTFSTRIRQIIDMLSDTADQN